MIYNRYNIKVKVIGGVGTITGDEEVIHGNNSKENNIVITPESGYEISKIIVDNNEIAISNSSGMVLDNFKNVSKNHLVEVEFKELISPTPITSKNVSIIIIAISLLLLIVGSSIMYHKKLKR